jgi:hypothetical protein
MRKWLAERLPVAEVEAAIQHKTVRSIATRSGTTWAA